MGLETLTAESVLAEYVFVPIDRGELIRQTPPSTFNDGRLEALEALVRFGEATEEIFWHQVSRYSFALHETFTYIAQTLQRADEKVPDGFSAYLSAMEENMGVHSLRTKKKFYPSFKKEEFEATVEKVRNLALETEDFAWVDRLDRYKTGFGSVSN